MPVNTFLQLQQFKSEIVFLEQVTVTAAPSLDYTLTPLSGDQYTSCLCANDRKTLSWTMTPTVLGKGLLLCSESLTTLSDILKMNVSLF